jgi:hypothetical protein
MVVRVITFIIAASAVTVGAQPGASVTFRTIARGADSKIAARRELVARTAGSWQLVWYRHSGAYDRPAVDTPREMVLAVFAGTKPDPGDSVRIASVTREGTGLVVRYHVQVAVTPAATASATPYHIIAVAADPAPVTFIEERDPRLR